MDQSRINTGTSNWKRWVVIWLVLFLVVAATTDLGLFVPLLGVAGLIFVFLGTKSLWQSMSAESVERVDISSLDRPREAVQVVGRAQPDGDPSRAPLTGTDCVAYRVEVTEDRPSSRSGTSMGGP